jgi:hypothetical protein
MSGLQMLCPDESVVSDVAHPIIAIAHSIIRIRILFISLSPFEVGHW